MATTFGNIENNSVTFVASRGSADMNKSELINAGQPITIESRNAPVFKASKELREAANRLPED